MLDADEMAAFEAWKQHKLTTHPDLSVNAFNAEMEAQAIAWEEGARQYINPGDTEVLIRLRENNPYRQAGMRGHTPHAVASIRPSTPPPVQSDTSISNAE